MFCEGKLKPGVRRKDGDGAKIASFVDLQLHLLDSVIWKVLWRYQLCCDYLVETLGDQRRARSVNWGYQYLSVWISGSERDIMTMWERSTVIYIRSVGGKGGFWTFRVRVCTLCWILGQKRSKNSLLGLLQLCRMIVVVLGF